MNITELERDQKIVSVLQQVMALYRCVLEMKYEEQQRCILQYILNVSNKHKELTPLKEVCEKVLQDYPEGMPHDSTLILEAKQLAGYPYSSVFPNHVFDEDMLLYKMFDVRIKSLFDTIPQEGMDRPEQLILERLWHVIHNTLVKNPNFKGSNPYYKRNYHEMGRAKKLWLELLDDDYKSYICYFQET